MTSSATPYVLWVAREKAAEVSDPELRERAGVEDAEIEVRTQRLSAWTPAVVPAGSRDEWGDATPVLLNVWLNQLPPEGRVYLIGPA